MIPERLVSFVQRLQQPEQRAAAAGELAGYTGAKSILVFGKDMEMGVYLPALGLPQTLRQGSRWQAFLERCAEAGQTAGMVPDPAGPGDLQVFGVADAGQRCILVFVGASPEPEMITAIALLLPLLGAKLVDERVVIAATGHAVAAREANRKARALNETLDLNRRELQRAVQLAEQELASRRLAENKLLEADRLKNDFLAMLAHELRNPLSAITMAIKLIDVLGADLPPALDKSHKTIKRQTEQLVRLVNDLLDVSRITQGTVTLQPAPVPVDSFVAAALEMMQPLIDSREHALTVNLPEQPVSIVGDAVRLCQIVGNLLDNAAKYTPKGGNITLDVIQRREELVIAVGDDGIGFTQEAGARIFNMFTQENRTEDRAADGLGIGLALVKRFVELHDGHISAASAGTGRGSVFTVTLPNPPQAHSAMVMAPPLSAATAQTTGKRVLLVDDNEDAADMMRMLLELEGHDIRTAYDGVSAIDAARVFSPEIVCLDIGLPDMTGYQLARKLRMLPGMNQVTLIAITGMGLERDRLAGRAAGFDRYVVKPIDTRELTALIAAPSIK
jgi:signal transduction histidine kinase